MVLCDLPYGTTRLPWDSVLPLDFLWVQYKRVIKPKGAIVLTANQPFTSVLIASNLEMYRYSWVWKKTTVTGFLNCNYRPMLGYEDVAVFSKSKCGAGSKDDAMLYRPQGLVEINKKKRNKAGTRGKHIHETVNVGADNVLNSDKEYVTKHTGYPINVIEFDNDKPQLHPTQKPVALFEYLIRTYTEEGAVVLDNCIGSGTTAVACMNTKRHFIGTEIDPSYYKIACERAETARRAPR